MTTYYRSIEELEAKSVAQDANDDGRDELHRRDFLKTAGFSLAAVAVTACQRPVVQSAIPHAIAAEDVVPGRAYWMASTCHGCAARCGVLVKCRDGRPIKLEGNPEHPLSKGGLCAIGQASILGLYDSQRLDGPQLSGNASDWAAVDKHVKAKLATAKKVRVVSSTLGSPTATRVIDQFLSRFEDGKHVVYDVPSASAIADAHEQTHGVRAIPHYRFNKADVVVSIDADFLGTWISPVEFTKGWSAKRGAAGTWHAQLEPRMSLTGSNADQRLRIHPDDITPILAFLAGRGDAPYKPEILERLKSRLVPGHSLVVSGSNRVEDQLLVNAINASIGAYGATIDIDAPSRQREGNDADLAALVAELPMVDALFVVDANPVYDLPEGEVFGAALARIPLVVTLATHMDETSRLAHVVAPEPHALESWRDSEPVAGVYAVTQPAISPLRNTREAIASFAAWSGKPAKAYDLIRELQMATDWDRTLHDGFAAVAAGAILNPQSSILNPGSRAEPLIRPSATFSPQAGRRATNETSRENEGHEAAASGETAALLPLSPPGGERVAVGRVRGGSEVATGTNEAVAPLVDSSTRRLVDFRLVLHASNTMLDGRHAHNAWLHELPDPVTKVTWDNYASLSPEAASRLGVKDGDVVKITAGKDVVELPAFVQPGQHDHVVAIALGYGRLGTDRFAQVGPQWLLRRTQLAPGEHVGKRVVHLAKQNFVKIEKTGATHPLASTQMHATIDGDRPSPIQRASNVKRHVNEHDLWPAKQKGAQQWAMAIDLARCTGCSGCVVGCQAENNVPVVGKDEVVRQREMHWIRIDRYYAGEGDDVSAAHQPMMCHHCGNAPCETVCPVLATVHSTDGLNQQVYNRCVGTRYCANNCPIKTRRFNWFDYPHEDRFANLVLNPDVAVRTRGVMEKCSMCIQRIEEARVEAKRQGIPIADGAVQTACQQSCPADAIVFGDLNDPKSRIAQVRRDPRHYLVLEELNLKPGVGYLALHDGGIEHGEETKHV